MGVHHIAGVADLGDLPPTCKLVLYGLAIDADARGVTPALNAHLRQLTGLSERAIRETLRALEKLKLIERTASFDVRLTLP